LVHGWLDCLVFLSMDFEAFGLSISCIALHEQRVRDQYLFALSLIVRQSYFYKPVLLERFSLKNSNPQEAIRGTYPRTSGARDSWVPSPLGIATWTCGDRRGRS
jgi:hypothetical protein